MANTNEKTALGLPATATDADVLARIAELQARHDQFAAAVIEALGLDANVSDEAALESLHGRLGTEAQANVLVLWSRTGREFNRGTYVIPATGSLVLDESKMDPIDLRELAADPRAGMARTSDPLTPESDIGRYKRAARPEPAAG